MSYGVCVCTSVSVGARVVIEYGDHAPMLSKVAESIRAAMPVHTPCPCLDDCCLLVFLTV